MKNISAFLFISAKIDESLQISCTLWSDMNMLITMMKSDELLRGIRYLRFNSVNSYLSIRIESLRCKSSVMWIFHCLISLFVRWIISEHSACVVLKQAKRLISTLRQSLLNKFAALVDLSVNYFYFAGNFVELLTDCSSVEQFCCRKRRVSCVVWRERYPLKLVGQFCCISWFV